MTKDAVSRCLLGGALGDSLGLPAEGLRAGRIGRMWPGPLCHRLLPGCGMVSDDTEHAVMTALSLQRHPDDVTAFQCGLARRMRWWFAGVPAGIGLATARSIIKLWCGVSPARSGVISAGNGPLMRAPVIGVWFHDDPREMDRFVTASTLITHTDPRALEAARIIAIAAAWAAHSEQNVESLWSRVSERLVSPEMKQRIPALMDSLAERKAVCDFADSIGRRNGYVSGFAPDTAAVALYAWLRYRGDFRAVVTNAILAGGDTDTVAFVAGSLAGIDTNPGDIPADWIAGLRDHPLSARSLADSGGLQSLRYPNWPFSLLRNALFFLIVLCHAFRRILPPY